MASRRRIFASLSMLRSSWKRTPNGQRETIRVWSCRRRLTSAERRLPLYLWFGGDAGAGIWSKILERSDDETLKWDLFLAPHHCSWSFFSDRPYQENMVPAKNLLTILDKKIGDGSIVIASSKPIKNDDDNPPHYDTSTPLARNICIHYPNVRTKRHHSRLPLKSALTARSLWIPKPRA